MRRLISAFVFCLFVVPAFGDTIYVDANGTGDYPTIQAAINAAANGDEIILEPGAYTGSGNNNISYLGKAITVRSTNPYEQSVVDSTIVDGQGSKIGFIFQNGEGPGSVLSGLTITNFSDYYEGDGGGIVSSSSPVVSKCKLIYNNPWFYGGGILNSGNMVVIDCTFMYNDAPMGGEGGAIINSGSMNIINCIFIDNGSTTIRNGSSGTTNIVNCLLLGGWSNCGLTAWGSGYVNVTNCTFSGMDIGIFSDGATVNVENCILWDIGQYVISGTEFTVSYSCIQDGFPGTGNINSNPLFVTGPDGDYYLSQTAAGQAINSPCVDTGSDNASNTGMDCLTTRTDEVNDTGTVDMGYHYGRYNSPILSVFPLNLQFTGDRDGANPASQTITIRNLGGGTLNWTASVDANWLSIDTNSGTCTNYYDADTVAVNVDINEMAEGTYYAHIAVSDPCALGNPQTVAVELRVIGPIIKLSKSTFYFTALEDGNNPANQILGISNIGSNVLNWQISETCDWLSVEPNCGSSTSEVNDVNIVVDISGLAAGSYNCQLTVYSDDAENSPQIVTVNLRVYGPIIELSENAFYFTAIEDGDNPANQVLGIQNIGGGILNWQLSNPCYWLSVDPNCGSSTSEVNEVNIIVDASGLTGGIYICQLTVFSDYAENSPQIFTVELSVTPITADPTAKIYWTDSGTGKIQRANLDGSNIEDLITLTEPSGIAFDQTGNKMYWTDAGTGKIQRANPDGNCIIDLITTGLSEPRGIALDVANGKMYWTNYGIDKIQRANLDGTNIEDVIITGTKPYGIALDTLNGKIYWTDTPGADSRIMRANLDGSDVEELFREGMCWIFFIDLDLFAGKLYWPNYSLYMIRRANLDGSNVELVYPGPPGGHGPMGIALDSPMGKMYWTASGSGEIYRANLDGSSVEQLVTGLSHPEAIAIGKTTETDDLKVTPFDGLESEGLEAGPFTPSSKIYTLTNNGPNSLDWTASVTQNWIEVSPSSGTLGPNEVDTVQISINSSAIGLDFGTHNDLLTVTNLANGIVQNRSIELEIGIFEFKLLALDGAGSDQFGYSVSISDDRCIVGTPYDDDMGGNSGSAYIFEFNGTDWIEQAKLSASDGATGDEFGLSVSIRGDRCIVGAWKNDYNGVDSGSAYIFEFNGTDWIEQAKLTASDGAVVDYFGASVKIDDNRCVIGAPQSGGMPSGNGKAYVFEFNGTDWIEQAKLTAIYGYEGDAFGCSVSIDGDRCIVGAYNKAYGMMPTSGAAYIFEFNDANWVQHSELQISASDQADGDCFGISVDIDDNRCVVGAEQPGMPAGSGKAYIFKFNGTNWIQQAKLTASDASGADSFGRSVGINDNRCIVGAYGDDDRGVDSGSAYIFEWNGTNWVQQFKLTASDGAGSDIFGYSVGIGNDCYIVGSPYDDDNESSSGSAYIYQNHRSSDLDKNFVVDFYDFAIFASQWLQAPGLPSADIAPLEGDDLVGYEDLAVFYQDWLDDY